MWDGVVAGVEVPRQRSIDIDDEFDFSLAKFLIRTSTDFKLSLMNDRSLSNQNVLITGAGGRIGSAVTRKSYLAVQL